MLQIYEVTGVTRMKRMVKLLINPGERVIKWLALLLVAGTVALASAGHLDMIISFLDSKEMTFKVGAAKVTAYKAIKSAATVILLLWTAGAVSDWVERNVRKMKRFRASNRQLLAKAIQIAVYFIVFLLALDILGIDLTALAIFSGAVGIGIGFGLQKITSNFISGIILLFEKSVEEGDLVELNDGTYGFVRNTGARYTLIETFDSKEIMIPNEDFITNRVVNWTFSNSNGRVDIPIGVSYSSDLDKVKELILEAASENPRCIKSPHPECYLREFGDSSVNFLLTFWVSDVTEGRYEPQSDVMFSIWHKFKEHGIEIPFPQRDVHIKQAS